MSKKIPKYLVLRDNQEKKNFWDFKASSICDGTETISLPTGDYTIRGFEEEFIVERKGKVSEWAQNLYEDRFTRELERMEEFKYPFVILEFTMSDLLGYPASSGIPKSRWGELKTNGRTLLKRTCELQFQFKSKIIFAGKTHGQEVAASLIKRLLENAHCEQSEQKK